MADDPSIRHLIALGFVTGAPAAPPKRGQRVPSLAIGGDSADYISLLKLAEHVGRNLGPHLAPHAIREKWLAGEIRFRVRWLGECPHGRLFFAPAPGIPVPQRDEAAPPEFLVDLENRGMPFKELIGLSEYGIYVGPGETAYLFASRADAARFWPWDDLYGSKRVTGRKVLPGAPAAYDWEAALIEAARFMREKGLPKSQAILVRHILEWFGEQEPSESQVKHHIGPLYVALRDVSERNSNGSPRK
jgi:hypothetical protein